MQFDRLSKQLEGLEDASKKGYPIRNLCRLVYLPEIWQEGVNKPHSSLSSSSFVIFFTSFCQNSPGREHNFPYFHLLKLLGNSFSKVDSELSQDGIPIFNSLGPLSHHFLGSKVQQFQDRNLSRGKHRDFC